MIEKKEFKEWCRFITTLPNNEKKLLLKNKITEYKHNPTEQLHIQIKTLKRILGVN
jgi:hypothetical protein